MFSAFTALVNLLTGVIRFFEGWRLRREARAVVEAEVKEAEAHANAIAAQEYLNRPDRAELSKRLHAGEL